MKHFFPFIIKPIDNSFFYKNKLREFSITHIISLKFK